MNNLKKMMAFKYKGQEVWFRDKKFEMLKKGS